MILRQRQQAAEFLKKAAAYLTGLGDSPLTHSDAQVDDFYRVWRNLPDRPKDAAPYAGIFPVAENSPEDSWVVMRPTNRTDSRGLIEFSLAFRRGESVTVNSGAPGRQELIDPRSDRAGSNRPIPEGVYKIGPVEKAKYGSWGPGLGSIWLDLIVLPEFKSNDRGAFGAHLDSNRDNSPGSAGCVVTATERELQTFCNWVGQGAKYLVVDHGLGFLRQCGYPQVLAKNVSGPTISRRMSARGLAFIKSWEELRLKRYLDENGLWTIGWGHLIQPGETLTEITEPQAEAIFTKDVRHFETGVTALVKVPVNQNQFDALVSFAFNAGNGSLSTSTLLRLLNTGNFAGAAAEFENWNKVEGKVPGTLVVSQGLVRRRAAERLMFVTGEYRNNA